jgi:actin-related protein
LKEAGFGGDAVRCAQQIKEKCAFLSPTSNSRIANSSQAASTTSDEGSTFELPDGTVINVDNNVRCLGPNSVLFPTVTSANYSISDEQLSRSEDDASGRMVMLPRAADPKEGVAALVSTSINKCDEELIPELWGNVVVAGGCSMLPNFPARMASEINRLRQDNYPYGTDRLPIRPISKVSKSAEANIIPHPFKPERGYNSQRGSASWVGGSMFASLDTYAQVAVTKAEWEEHGAVIMQRKCF